MVASPEKSQIATQAATLPEVSVVPQAAPEQVIAKPAVKRVYCIRCGTKLMKGYDEPQCLNCGYADYSSTPEASQKGQSLLSAATRYVLRYVGDFPTLSETLAQVKLIRIRNRVAYQVECPFCDKTMEQSSLSGKRPEVREQRYKCPDGHRVSLVSIGRNDSLGWR